MHIKKAMIAMMAGLVMLTTGVQAERGSDGQANIIYWQAPSILNPYLSGGTKDVEASSLVLEPLANFSPDGVMIPVLAEGIPTPADDLKSITWKLKKGVVWSDGALFTADDVVFTADYCLDPTGGCNAISYFTDVESVVKIDSHTVKVNFSGPKPFPYGPFVSAHVPILQKAQFQDCIGAKAPECTTQNFGPIGTGPFKVTEFRANDVSVYAANENYREAGKPHFSTIVLKGGGEPASAARSVLEIGEFDYAWNLQIEPEVIQQMEQTGKGKVVAAFGTLVERLLVNLSNSKPEMGDKRSTYQGGNNPHPFLGDPAVRRALSLAIDREILVEAGYGKSGKVTCNILPAPTMYASTTNDWCKNQNIEEANRLLEEAGWKRGSDGVRVKDGIRLSILYQTSTNSVRQATQALIKQMWQQIGVETELKNISAAVFFGSNQGSPDTYQKFFADIQMYAHQANGIDPEAYMANWQCSGIPDPSNQWIGTNMPRYCDPEYDELVKKMGKTAVLEERAALAKQMNDKLIGDGALIPLIHRGRISGQSVTLGGVNINAWDSELWNVEDWYRIK